MENGMTFVKIPGTSFEMMTTPVTRGHWKEVMGNMVPGKGKFERSDEHPVESVALREAEAFCQKLNFKKDGYRYRLPHAVKHKSKHTWRTHGQ